MFIGFATGFIAGSQPAYTALFAGVAGVQSPGEVLAVVFVQLCTVPVASLPPTSCSFIPLCRNQRT